jgi:CubicO group peptidase (beta-lactamase class C family)
VLRRGKWIGARLVSEEWLTASMTPTSTRVSTYAGYPSDYGLLWWLMPLDGAGATGDRDRTIWAAVGNFNNWLFIVPKHDLIVVVTGGDNRSFGTPVGFLYREILPAVAIP